MLLAPENISLKNWMKICTQYTNDQMCYNLAKFVV
jgi:hypothetical protein